MNKKKSKTEKRFPRMEFAMIELEWVHLLGWRFVEANYIYYWTETRN